MSDALVFKVKSCVTILYMYFTEIYQLFLQLDLTFEGQGTSM
jgi:hypothetical protein